MSALPALRRRHPGSRPRLLAGPRIEDAVRAAAELTAAGLLVAVDHVPGRSADGPSELAGLSGRLAAAGLAAGCELDLPVDRLGTPGAVRVAEAAREVGVAICLLGAAAAVDDVAAALPEARIAVQAAQPRVEARCDRYAGRRVRLQDGRGAAADLAFVRCLNLLMAGDGHLAVATGDPRLLAVSGERAAWHDRPHETWEYLMPYGRRSYDRQRLLAAGAAVRVPVHSGSGAPAALVRRLAGLGLR